MKAVGLIVEYNPLHNGHLFHLEQSKKISGSDYAVCVMSGNFIQRGEPALINKWARAEMALRGGADLVLELPAAYAMASAEYFALGAVKILDSLGVVDTLCFGSESGDLQELDAIASILAKEPPAFQALLKSALDRGLSYPAAREAALKTFLDEQVHAGKPLETLMGTSNNILGIEYLKAIRRLNSSIHSMTIPRVGAAYHSLDLQQDICSATAARNKIRQLGGTTDSDELARCLPFFSQEILQREFSAGRGPVYMDHYELVLLSALRGMSSDDILLLPYVAEGLENRLKAAAGQCGALEELIQAVCTRRYPRTRIQRSIFSLLTGILNQELQDFTSSGGPRYIRVLGFTTRGRKLLSVMKKQASLPIVIKTADFKYHPDPVFRRMLEIDVLATDRYVLGYQNPAFRKSGQDFIHKPVMLD